MNHRKFIELLNLYIDGEASPGEAAEVEREVQNDPARRRIYNDYCRIQAATRAAYHHFRIDTPEEADAPAKVIALQRSRGMAPQTGRSAGRPFRRIYFWMGGALAACLAVAFALSSLPRGGAPQLAEQTPETAGVSAIVAEAAPVPPTAKPTAPEPAPASKSYAAPFAAQTRADPYLVRLGGKDVDPFSLNSTPVRTADFGDSALVLTPAISSVETKPLSEQSRKLQALLRAKAEVDAKQAAAPQPVNLRINNP